jgi:hypothetical protein
MEGSDDEMVNIARRNDEIDTTLDQIGAGVHRLKLLAEQTSGEIELPSEYQHEVELVKSGFKTGNEKFDEAERLQIMYDNCRCWQTIALVLLVIAIIIVGYFVIKKFFFS